jgi:hypothetical protein
VVDDAVVVNDVDSGAGPVVEAALLEVVESGAVCP